MKKRLFISSILMTLVLLVAITTATFAWYSATANAEVGKAGTSAQMTTATAGEVAAASYQLKVTITQTADENLYLIDRTGAQNVYVNGGIFANSKESKTSIGQFTLTCVWYDENGENAIDDAQVLASLHGDYTFELEGKGNIELLKDGSSALTANVASSLDVKVTMSEAGVCTVVYIRNHGAESGSVTTGYFAVRPNNANGLEYDGTEFTTLAASFDLTKLVTDGTHYWVLSNAIETNEGWNAASHSSEEVFLHSEDKIAVK